MPGRAGEVDAGHYDGEHVVAPTVAQVGLPPYGVDVRGRLRLVMTGARDEVWAIPLGDGDVASSPRRLAAADDDGAYHLVRAHGVSTAIVTCDASGCALAGVAWAD